MAKAHDRIIELVVTADESDDSLEVTAVNYYRTRANLDDSNPFALTFTAAAASGSHEVEFGEIMPPPTHILLTSTFQA